MCKQDQAECITSYSVGSVNVSKSGLAVSMLTDRTVSFIRLMICPKLACWNYQEVKCRRVIKGEVKQDVKS